MNQDARTVFAFFKRVEADPRDVELRRIFADWLEEHDEPELARPYREFDLERYDAEQTLADFCKRYRANPKELLEAIKAGQGYCFDHDDGPEAMREAISWNSDVWQAIKLLSDMENDEDDDTDDFDRHGSFRCAC